MRRPPRSNEGCRRAALWHRLGSHFMIMDLVLLARLTVLLALAVVVSVTAAVLVAVPVFPPVAVPFPLPVEYLRWEA